MKKTVTFFLTWVCLIAISSLHAQRYLTPTFSGVEVTPNVTYGVNATVLFLSQVGQAIPQPLQADIYEPAGDTECRRPLIILMHSGGFLPPQVTGGCVGTKNDADVVNLATRLAKLGYVVAAINYRLGWSPVDPNPETRRFQWINALYRGVQDSRTAVRFFRKSFAQEGNPYAIDPERIVMWGVGTGGFIAYASAALDAVEDTHTPEFTTAGGPMVLAPVNGNPDGTSLGIVPPGYPGFPVGDTLCYTNHVGFSSGFNMAVNMGGALPDPNWLNANDLPAISYHVPTDPLVPCGTDILKVFPPMLNDPLTPVSGSCAVQAVVNQLGLNTCMQSASLNDQLSQLANQRSGGVEGLFLFPASDPAEAGPWAYSSSSSPYGVAGSNCNTNVTVANLYLDTIVQYFAPRAFNCMNLGVSSTPELSAGVSAAATPIISGQNAVFNITGTPNSAVTYNLNGGAGQTVILNGSGMTTVTVSGAIANQTLNLIFIQNAVIGCSRDLTGSAMVIVNPLPAVDITTPTTSICNGGSAVFSVSGAPNSTITYRINNGPIQVLALSGNGTGNIILDSLTIDRAIALDSFFMNNGGFSMGLTAIASVAVSPLPAIACPAPITVNTSSNGAGDCTGVAVWTHPSDTAGACGPITLTMSIDNGPPIAVTPGATISQTLFRGLHTISYVLRDGKTPNPNTVTCSFSITVIDDEAPDVDCVNQTIVFNGQNSILLNAFDLVDADDNCNLASLAVSPASIACQQLGLVVPVAVTVADSSNNVSSCTAQVTVAGLPCGWSQNPDGVNCAGGNSIAFNPATSIWTATSADCFYANPFTSDELAFAQRTLCGDGSITAQVTSISGGQGWAGVTMRESNAAGARKVQLTTNLSTFSRREVRYETNGQAYPQQILSFNRYWLRVIRTGNQVTGYVSSNGVNWYFVMAATVNMSNCIQVGLVLTNSQQTGTVSATFANVSATGGGNNLAGGSDTGEGLPFVASNSQLEADFDLYPNPTSGELNLDLTQYAGKAVRLEVYSLQGQLLQFKEIDEVQTGIERMDISAYADGMYMVKVKCEGTPDVAKRVMLGVR